MTDQLKQFGRPKIHAMRKCLEKGNDCFIAEVALRKVVIHSLCDQTFTEFRSQDEIQLSGMMRFAERRQCIAYLAAPIPTVRESKPFKHYSLDERAWLPNQRKDGLRGLGR